MDKSYIVTFRYVDKVIELTADGIESGFELAAILIKNGYQVICVCSSEFYQTNKEKKVNNRQPKKKLLRGQISYYE